MDHQRQPSKSTGRRKSLLVIALFVAVGLMVSLSTMDFGTPRIDRDSLQIDTVQRGDLDIKVSANGVLLPVDVQWIASQVEGRVSAIHRRAGDRVEVGQLLVELNNPAIVTAAEEALSALDGGRAEKLSYAVDLQNHLLNQKSITLQAKFAYQSAKLKLDAETKLRKTTSIIADIDYRRTQLSVEQLLASYQIEQERMQKSKTNIATQLAAKEAQVMQLSKALDRAENKVAALQVSAGMAGVLQEMDLKVGQRLLPGSEIARVARQDRLYAELKVIARQASEIAVGQRALVDTRNGMVQGIVSRIDPAVSEGTVLIDIDLTGALPKGARPELQVEGTVYIAQLRETLFVGKPSYSKNNSNVSVYRLYHDNPYAERIVIKTGQMSVNYIEILDGLEQGDQIILSDSSDWRDHARILIN